MRQNAVLNAAKRKTKKHKDTLQWYKQNLFFAGEVLDVDAITGGFNLQAAWTTGYVAGKAMGV